MLLSHGPEPEDGRFSLDDECRTEEYENLNQIFEALGASTKPVCLFSTADPESGIHVIHWEDARLGPDRTFTRLHSERLRVAAQPLE
ncbi:hypothetical protein [Streptomyces carpinensis]|uniref:Uncharacterized protein n=1 Tax=Streptomyces carpinensis TaxID=66369 RepID=A0ABV1W6D3_9ACTN|nr:hypothetical protein [Streptomyces carpinensis]